MMLSVKNLLVYLWIILIPFQDSGLQNTKLGFLGASPAFIPLIILIILSIFEVCIKGNINKKLLLYIFYLIIISCLYLLIFGLNSNNTNLIIKTIKLLLLFLLLVYPIFFIDYNKLKHIDLAVNIAFIITLIGLLINDILGIKYISSSQIFHFHENMNLRPRGFTSESSAFSVMILTLGILSAYYTNRRIFKWLIIITMIAALLYCRSKGGLITFLLTLLILAILNSAKKPLLGIAQIVIFGVLIYNTYNIINNYILIDIQKYTSIATRSTLILTALITIIYNPLGVGFSGFLPAINKYTPLAIEVIRNFGDLNFSEISSYINASSDINISTKTLFFDFMMYYGVPFVILYTTFIIKVLQKLYRNNHQMLLFGFIFVLLASSTYITGFGEYNLSLIYGVAYYAANREKDSNDYF